jgi:hypothetical protein
LYHHFSSLKNSSNHQKKNVHVCQSSLVDEQQQQFSFNELENQLINALIGIQGRGKSASPQ